MPYCPDIALKKVRAVLIASGLSLCLYTSSGYEPTATTRLHAWLDKHPDVYLIMIEC